MLKFEAEKHNIGDNIGSRSLKTVVLVIILVYYGSLQAHRHKLSIMRSLASTCSAMLRGSGVAAAITLTQPIRLSSLYVQKLRGFTSSKTCSSTRWRKRWCFGLMRQGCSSRRTALGWSLGRWRVRSWSSPCLRRKSLPKALVASGLHGELSSDL